METIQEVQDFCKSIKLNPKRIFIASNGTVLTEWHSKKQSLRYAKEINKYYTKLGSTHIGPEITDVTTTDLEDWEQIAYAEMLAPRH